MSSIVQFTGPRRVELAEVGDERAAAGQVLVRTLYSGISAGTELTAYRGSNPYLDKYWDAALRLFVQDEATFRYPVAGWGYSEVGEVVEVAPDVTGLAPGDVVWGIWGHRSSAVLPAKRVLGHRLAKELDPLLGVFPRVGAVALNATLAADIHLREHVALFGQGVIGLLATGLARLNGGTVTAVDRLPNRLALARSFGADSLVAAGSGPDVASTVRGLTGGRGADVCIELSGSYAALHEAVRCVAPGGRVVAAGFYQGEGIGLRLGEEFHHNRVQIVASQIGGVPNGWSARWDVERLQTTVMDVLGAEQLPARSLVTHVVDAADVADAFDLLDNHPEDALQVVLRF